MEKLPPQPLTSSSSIVSTDNLMSIVTVISIIRTILLRVVVAVVGSFLEEDGEGG